MATNIDIALVKEQLRLLGHNVPDEVIMDFVKGLGSEGPAATSGETQRRHTQCM